MSIICILLIFGSTLAGCLNNNMHSKITNMPHSFGLAIFGFVSMILSLVYCTAGGAFRDVFFIGRPPIFLTSRDIYLPILMAWALYIMLLFGKKIQSVKSSVFYPILTGIDLFGTGVFIHYGVKAAYDYNLTPLEAILSGVITAVGGGYFFRIIQTKDLWDSFTSNWKFYRLILCISILYTINYYCCNSNIQVQTQLFLGMYVYLYCALGKLPMMSADIAIAVGFDRSNLICKVGLVLSNSQRFWSIVNPMKGIHSVRTIGSGNGYNFNGCYSQLGIAL